MDVYLRTLSGRTTNETLDWILSQYLGFMHDMDAWGGEPKNLDPLMNLWHDDVARRMRAAGKNPDDDEAREAFVDQLRR